MHIYNQITAMMVYVLCMPIQTKGLMLQVLRISVQITGTPVRACRWMIYEYQSRTMHPLHMYVQYTGRSVH